jgi:hypothetical protein
MNRRFVRVYEQAVLKNSARLQNWAGVESVDFFRISAI